MIAHWDLSSSQVQFKNINLEWVTAHSVFVLQLKTVDSKTPDLVQRNHGVGDSKNEVDIVLRHLLCDEGKRWVIL